MDIIAIEPVNRPFEKTLRVPGSKSITNRALPLAAMAEGTSTLRGVLFADDTRQMIGALQTLGYDLRMDEQGKSIALHGRGRDIPSRAAELFCGNSGTTIRFLSALCSITDGEYLLDGVARMRSTPSANWWTPSPRWASGLITRTKKAIRPSACMAPRWRAGVCFFRCP